MYIFTLIALLHNFYLYLYIDTHDIQEFAVTAPGSQSITMRADFIPTSQAKGSMFAILLIGSTSVDFSRSVYLTLDRDQSQSHTVNGVWGGVYTVIVYDIEYDGIPGLGEIREVGRRTATAGGKGKIHNVQVMYLLSLDPFNFRAARETVKINTTQYITLQCIVCTLEPNQCFLNPKIMPVLYPFFF